MQPDLIKLRQLASDVARSAGRLIVRLRDDAVSVADTKSTPTDLVTHADRAAEQEIVRRLLDERPDDAILGEEGASRSGQSGIEWIIDPIDGTTNYVYGIPAFAVSIAARQKDQFVAGAVFNPLADELFAAHQGGGATLNSKPISIRPPTDIANALVATGFGYDPDQRRRQGRLVAGLLPEIRDIRRIGAAALDLCAVACGRVDAFFETGLKIWDYAAGSLIATEAGATCSDLDGNPASGEWLVTAAPELLPVLTQRLQELRD